MKHPTGAKWGNHFEESGRQLADAAAEVGVQLTPEQVASLLLHLGMVLEANRTMNLTRIDDVEAAVVGHVVDSLALVAVIREIAGPVVEGESVDLGSGAGFPGFPLAILSGSRVTLVESVGKKAMFLRSVAAELDNSADVAVLGARAEEVALERPGAFQIVTARALAALPSLVELAAPLLSAGGRLFAMKGQPSPEEIARGREVAVLVGLTEERVERYRLPGSARDRSVIVYRKKGEPLRPLPRRPGMAQRKPLA